MNYIRWFQEIQKDEIDLVGGKGANLGEMACAGFPVPPGFCLTAEAYRHLIEVTGLYPIIERLLDQIDLSDPTDVEAKTARIREIIGEQPIPEDIAEELINSYHVLAAEMNAADPANLPVAVRSSATAEDLPTASFAGQQDTYLNIRGENSLLEHVRRCWASLWTARAVTYRSKKGFDQQKVFVSVVVQAMVESEISGILFTANPVNGDRREAVINASWGLGEAVVSGFVSPDTLTVNKLEAKIVARHLADKEDMIVYGPDGGTLELKTPADWRRKPALKDREALDLAALGTAIEDHYGNPQDIEWALAKGKWYILQARPITTLVPVVSHPGVAGEYNRTMMIEIFPDALSPAFLSVVCPLLHGMFDFTFETLGFNLPQGIDAVASFYNQPYFHREYIEQALSTLAPDVREPLVSSIINPFSHDDQEASGDFSRAYLGMAARMLRFMVLFPRQLPRILAQYHAEIDEISVYSLDAASDEEVVAQIRRLVFETVSNLLNYDFLMIALIGRTYRLLGSLLNRYYGEETDEVVAKLISGVTGNVTMETNKRLWDLAQQAKASTTVSETLRSCNFSKMMSELGKTAEGQAYLDELDHFLNVFGHREIRLDILYPTWGEDPAPVFGFLRSYLDADESQSPYVQQRRLIAEREQLTEHTLARVRQGLWGRAVMTPLFRWLLDKTQVHTRERDTMHFEWTRLFPPLRRLLLELGRRWSERHLIGTREDIFYLTFNEMERMTVSPFSLLDELPGRRETFEVNRTVAWPDIIRDGQELFLKKGISAGTEGEGLRGVAGSPGVVSGPSRIICGPEEFYRLQKGDILIAPLTNPVWTPLFSVAGAVVTEVGGILSHGAIVAREYGIPAVMSVSGATKQIPDGQIITVDGSQGVVYLGEMPQ